MKTQDIPTNRLYGDLAWLWPLLSPPAEYAEEALHWRTVLHEALGPGRHAILELGVGGGHNLSHLASGFDAVAVDLSEPMLSLSRRLNPDVEHFQGDMRTFRIDRRFEAVLIHDAISHMTTENDLRAVFETAYAHLEPGGIVVAAPDWFRETFHSPWTSEWRHADAHIQLTTFEYTHDPDPADTAIEAVMTHFIEQDGAARIEHDRLVLGLFPRRVWKNTILSTGFSFRQRRFHLQAAGMDYVLLVGRKPRPPRSGSNGARRTVPAS